MGNGSPTNQKVKESPKPPPGFVLEEEEPKPGLQPPEGFVLEGAVPPVPTPVGPSLLERVIAAGGKAIDAIPAVGKIKEFLYGTPEEQESIRKAMDAKREEFRTLYPQGAFQNKRTGRIVPLGPDSDNIIPGMDLAAGLIPIGKLVGAHVQSSELWDPERGQLVLPGDPNLPIPVPLGVHGTVQVPQWVAEAGLNTIVGLGQVSADVVEGLSSPTNLALIAGMVLLPEAGAAGIVKSAVEAGFSLEMASQAVDTIVRGFEEAKRGNIVKAGEHFASAIVTSVFAILAGKAAGTRTKAQLDRKAAVKKRLKDEGMAEPDAEFAAEREAAKLEPVLPKPGPRVPEIRPEVPEVPVRGAAPPPTRQKAIAEARLEFNQTLKEATDANIESALLSGKPPKQLKPGQPTVTVKKGVVGRAMQLIVREKAAELAAQRERSRAALQQARDHFDRLTPEEGLEFIDRLETGRPQATAVETKFGAKMRELLDHEWARVLERKQGMGVWIDNYFPHLYKNTKTARQVFTRRPLLGPKSFLRKRKFPTLRQAMEWAKDQGVALEPISTNPVDLTLAKLHEMRKFTTGQDIMEMGRAMGIVRFVDAKSAMAGRAPAGFTQIKDPVGTVWGPGKVKITEAYDEILFEQMNQFARSLGIEPIRKVSLGRGKGQVLGYTIKGTSKVWTKFATPESVLTHELGHQLDFRYPEFHALIKDKSTAHELRRLADLRYEGKEDLVSGHFKKYVRQGTEKIANLIHAYVHAPDKLRYAAPETYSRLVDILRSHAELKPLMDIKPSLVLKGQVAEKGIPGMQVLGYWYTPQAAARMLNNHLSPGLWRPGTFREKIGRGYEELREGDYRKAMEEGGFALYDLYRYSGNLLNQVQLGVGSMFHFTFTAMDSTISNMSLGIQKIAHGKVGAGLKDVVHGDIVVGPWLNWVRGNKMLKEFYEPGSQGEFYTAAIDNLIKAGGRTKMDPFYLNSSVENFWRAWREGGPKGKGEAALRSIPAAIEYLSRPIMQAWVPRVKMGVFSKLAEFELEKLGPNADWFSQRDSLARAWDSADNRLGQLVYDNLFWSRVIKDAGMMSVRSLGWNIGTFRELGGGIVDLGRAIKDPKLTPRLAYTLALPIVLGIHGAMVQYLLTGLRPGERRPDAPPDSPDPSPIKDMAFPRSGRVNPDGTEERTSIPGYHKDIYQYFKSFPLGPERGVRQFASTLRHKLHPMANAIFDMMSNEDFYGERIRNEEDPLVDQLKDSMEFVAEQFQPFWVRNVKRRLESGGGLAEGVESALGILPAPATIYRSRAEQLAGIYVGESLGGAMTKEQAERRKVRRDLIRKGLSGDPNYRENIRDAIINEKINRRDYRLILNSLRERPLERMVKRLSLEKALNVFDLATPSEQERLRGVLLRKQRTLFDMPLEQRENLQRRLDAALGRSPRTRLTPPSEVPPMPIRSTFEGVPPPPARGG